MIYIIIAPKLLIYTIYKRIRLPRGFITSQRNYNGRVNKHELSEQAFGKVDRSINMYVDRGIKGSLVVLFGYFRTNLVGSDRKGTSLTVMGCNMCMYKKEVG